MSRLPSNKLVVLSVVAIAALGVSGCKKTSYKNSNSPDEFAISRNAPLVVPPDFALVPPKPGAPRAIANDSQAQAAEALFGPGAKPPPKSTSEQQLLDKAGANKPDPGVRSNAGDSTTVVNKGSFVQELLAAKPGSTNPAVASVATGG